MQIRANLYCPHTHTPLNLFPDHEPIWVCAFYMSNMVLFSYQLYTSLTNLDLGALMYLKDFAAILERYIFFADIKFSSKNLKPFKNQGFS